MARRWIAIPVASLLAACGAGAAQRPPPATAQNTPPPQTGVAPAANNPAPPPAGTTSPSGVDAAEARACAAAVPLVMGRQVRGTTTGGADVFHATCAFGAGSPDAVYRFALDQPSHVVVRVQGGYDTVLHLRANCVDGDTELACNDDAGDARHSSVEADLPPGQYFVVVDGYAGDSAGVYTLTYAAQPAPSVPPPSGVPRVAWGQGARVEPGQGTGVSGSLTFAKRGVTPHGLTRATMEVPAPHAAVEAIGPDGAVVASGETDDQGQFRLEIPTGTGVRVRALSRTSYLGADIRVISDPGTEKPYEVSTQPFRVMGGERITLRADVGGVEPAGGFNILSQFVRYLPFIQRGFGRPLPPLFAFWRRGNNLSLPQGNITAFLGEYYRHHGTYALQIQGGVAGREDNSDSDQFDDPVILHEFSHYVIHTMAGDYSIGGQHADRELHFPAQALDEGAATAMGCAVIGDGHYWDTAGLEPQGELLIEDQSETMATLPDRGIGSQNTAQLMVWDLIDGADGIQDRDNDGVAIGLSGMMRIYASFHDDNVSFPAIHTILERGVSLGLFTQDQATRLTHSPVDHGFVFPVPVALQWPQDVTLPGNVRGRVDGRTQPAPSGGRNVPSNGFDSIRTYRFTITHRAMVYLDVTIQGDPAGHGPGNVGSQENGTDVDLYLLSRDTDVIDSSTGDGREEHVHRFLDPGTYIVLVRDGDISQALRENGTDGNRADFTLSLRQPTEFH